MLLPLLMFIISKYFSQTKLLFILWLLCVLFYLSGISITDFLGGTVVTMGKLGGYLNDLENNSNTAWINFLIYGSSPVLMGIYFVCVKKYRDKIYLRLLNTYILTNCVYVLVMNLSFSVRFAYLSEFLMPIVLIYPIIKKLGTFRFLQLSFIFIVMFFIKAIKILF